MSVFQDIKFEDPGYPIYKSFIVPYCEDGNLRDVREVKPEDVEKWRGVLERLRTFLLHAFDFARETRNIEGEEKLELLCDLISIFLRSPLNREILPALAPNPLKLYVLLRLLGFEERPELPKLVEDPLEFTEVVYGRGVVNSFMKTDMARDLDSHELSNLLEHCWLIFPADTRPGLNSSGLIPHLLLTSSLAWTLAISKGFSRKTAIMLRLAAILHDMGKPFRYRDHVTASIEVSERLLNGLISNEEINEVKDFIRTHHGPKTSEGRILQEADTYASAIDRLKNILEDERVKRIRETIDSLAKSTGCASSHAYSSGLESWEFWLKINEVHGKKAMEDLSVQFVRNLRKITDGFTKPIEVGGAGVVSNAMVVLIDIGGVQRFIYRSWDLRQVVAASLVVDTLVMAQIPAFIQMRMASRGYWLPHESFLYVAGAVVELIIPTVLLDHLKKDLEELGRKTIRCGLSLRLAHTQLLTDYAKSTSNLSLEIYSRKFETLWEEFSVRRSFTTGERVLCDFCYLNPPDLGVPPISGPEGDLKACRVCRMLRSIGSDIHFKSRYGSYIPINRTEHRAVDVFDMKWSDEDANVKASEYIVELIAGHDKSELTDMVRLRNLAVIKVDGNLIGAFITTCLSPTDAYERSARIDMALKKSIETAVHAIFDGVQQTLNLEVEAAKAALAVKLGILYAGGDDAVMLVPSWAAPLIALILGKEFVSNIGNARSLAVGIAVAPARASIWALIDAASKLMDIAKKKARATATKSFICFDVVESGALSGSSVEERFHSLEERRLTSQPLDVESFEKLLSILLNSPSDYENLASNSYIASRMPQTLKKGLDKRGYPEKLIESVETAQTRLKDIKNSIGEVLLAARSALSKAKDLKAIYPYVFSITCVYATRQRVREAKSKERKRAYSIVESLIPINVKDPSMLSDAERLIKILGGGAL